MKKKFITMQSLVFAGLIYSTNGIYAAEITTKDVSVENKLEIRGSASHSSNIIGELEASSNITIINEIVNDLDEKWYYIETGGQKGWIPSTDEIERVLLTDYSQSEQSDAQLGQDEVVPAEKMYNLFSKLQVKESLASDAKVVGVLTFGEYVNVIESATDEFGKTWSKIQSGEVNGWVPTIALQKEQPLQENHTIQVEKANIRLEPSQNAEILTSLKKGEPIQSVLIKNDNQGNSWLKVIIEDKTIGWLLSTDVIVAEEDSTEKNPTEEISPDAEKQLDADNDALTIEGKESLVIQEKKVSEPVQKSLESINSVVSNMIVGTHNAYLYRGADYSYETVEHIPFQSQVKIIDEFVNKNGELWYRVETSRGTLGWVRSWELLNSVDDFKYVYPILSTPLYSNADGLNKLNITVQVGEKLIWITDTDNYSLVETEDGKRGWISKSLTVDTAKLMIAGTRNANLYRGAAYNFSIIEKVPYLSKVYVWQEFINSNGEKWFRITTPGGNVGWIRSWELLNSSSEAKYVYPIINTNLYRSANDTDRINAKVHAGQSLIWIADFQDYSLVESEDGNRGWIKKSLTSEILKKMIVGTRNANLYRGASYSYKIIELVPYNSTVNLLGEFTNAAQEKWYRISTPAGNVGWIRDWELLESTKDIKNIYPIVNTNLYRSANDKDRVNANVNIGSSLIWISDFKDYSLVETQDGKRGWIKKNLTSDTIKNMIIATRNANMYRGASYRYDIVEKVPYLSNVKVWEEFTNSQNETWYRISTNSGNVGWIRSWELLNSVNDFIYLYTKDDINLYRSASLNEGIHGKLPIGSKLVKISELNEWYLVETLDGKRGWVESKNTTEIVKLRNHTTVAYNLSLKKMLEIQMKASPQTDKKYRTYVSKDYLTSDGVVIAEALNVRGGPGTSYWKVGVLEKGEKVKIIGESNGWYEVEYPRTWKNANEEDTLYYLTPSNFDNSSAGYFQFLKLSGSSAINPDEVNKKILSGKGILEGRAKAFIQASNTYNVNEIYLISHALLETGNGTSLLSSGRIEVGELGDNKWVSFQPNGTYVAEWVYDVESKKWTWIINDGKNIDRTKVKNIRKVYNMFGYGAYDWAPYTLGSIAAYREGWFDPDTAIIGGAKYIGQGYINNGQDTLYKMRWNPDAAVMNGKASHQYATDIGWAYKISRNIYNYYSILESYNLTFEVPIYVD